MEQKEIECSNCGEPLGKDEIDSMKEMGVSKYYWVCFGCDSVRDSPYEVVA